MTSLALVALALTVCAALAVPDGNSPKTRRITGMFPRPIVGRGDPSATWLLDVSEIAEMEGKPKRGEISGLFAYPRVGRLDPLLLGPPREGPRGGRYHQGARKRDGAGSGAAVGGGGGGGGGGDNANGLWFGPRLGKRPKPEDGRSPWTLISLREYPTGMRRQDAAFTPRLGRESGEDPGEDEQDRRPHAETV